jgi:glutamate synthase domain-containing protein 2
MARSFFFAFSIIGLLFTLIGSLFQPQLLWALALLVPYIAIGLFDLYIAKHNVLRIYPVIGHFRYGLEFISPEIRQYFIETNQSGRPFNREHRNLVYRRAKQGDDTQPFGTQYDIDDVGYNRANHSLSPKVVSEADSRVKFGGSE